LGQTPALLGVADRIKKGSGGSFMPTKTKSKSKSKSKLKSKRRWSAAVTQHSNSLDLEPAIFKQSSARRVALSLKRSAERSQRREAAPYQSAMSMLNFYINRTGTGLSEKQKRVLMQAKDELRRVFHRG
jgi:hypothetical protein